MHVVDGEWEDDVPRLHRFMASHPDVTITPPGNGTIMWRARATDDIVIERFSLGLLMDVLEARDR